jgi:hypothetical protein
MEHRSTRKLGKIQQSPKRDELDGVEVGLRVDVTDPTTRPGTPLCDCIAAYLGFIQDNRREKTWKAYRANLAKKNPAFPDPMRIVARHMAENSLHVPE